MSKRIWLLVASALACIVSPQQALVNVSARPLAGYIETESHAQNQAAPEYRIKLKDLLSVSIEGVCIYNPNREVDNRGKIRMPLIGEVQAEGRTVKELEAEIAAGLNEYIIEPQVHIRVMKPRT